jgi:hypothetical protein
MATFKYYVNLDERGEFYADVRNEQGKTVYEIDTAEAHWLYDTYRIRVDKVNHIRELLVGNFILTTNDDLIFGE